MIQTDIRFLCILFYKDLYRQNVYPLIIIPKDDHYLYSCMYESHFQSPQMIALDDELQFQTWIFMAKAVHTEQ